jgi:hypothetical protein
MASSGRRHKLVLVGYYAVVSVLGALLVYGIMELAE